MYKKSNIILFSLLTLSFPYLIFSMQNKKYKIIELDKTLEKLIKKSKKYKKNESPKNLDSKIITTYLDLASLLKAAEKEEELKNLLPKKIDD